VAFNILIVDDSSSMRAIIAKIIKTSGFNAGELLEAADGKEAMKVLASEWVDIVITDINMPHMSGMDLLGEMKKDELLRSIPVLVVTTEGSDTRVQEVFRLGAIGYIKKPFLPEDVKKTLSTLMGEEVHEKRDNDKGYEDCDF
jgi:two-component system chemotaxis response regulator CheY